jgi:hypothetical protein
LSAPILKRSLKLNVWVPGKDKGTDLLITDKENIHSLSLQAKSSKDHLPGLKLSTTIRQGVKASGWWQVKIETLENSKADSWIMVLYGLKGYDFIIAKPVELLAKCKGLNRKEGKKGLDIYLCVTSAKPPQCWETRALSTGQRELIATGTFQDHSGCLDFTDYLNKWDRIGGNGKIAPLR